ncbi:Homeobox-like_domain superfamily [Hexamita inflata]|uniref:Homeobox-like_domain superfamily n=1 Tax=Hexamita inflata TaxID=28002 RepID=A0ABP1HHT7_9EUKA
MAQHHVNKRWTLEERETFFKYLPQYGNDFYSYTVHMDRTHSQIKSFYHNWLKTLPAQERERIPKHERGGSHKRYRAITSPQETPQPEEKPKQDFCTGLVVNNLKSVE